MTLFVEVIRHASGPTYSSVAKAGRLKPINRERAFIRAARVKLRRAVRTFLAEQAPLMAAQLVRQLPQLEKARDPQQGAVRLPPGGGGAQAVETLDFEDWQALIQVVGKELGPVVGNGGEAALQQLGLDDEEVLDLMRTRATAWAQQRSAEMVGMRVVDGELVPNPDARWRIDETTRDALRAMVDKALDEGWSTDELSERIVDSYAFSEERADAIARTEVAMADVAGAIEGYRVSGLVAAKSWLTAEDEKVSAICQDCADAGQIPLDAKFPGGFDAPPGHVNCRCALLPWLADELESETPNPPQN